MTGNRGAVSICYDVRAVPLQNSYVGGVSRTPEDARLGLGQELTLSGVTFTADLEGG